MCIGRQLIVIDSILNELYRICFIEP